MMVTEANIASGRPTPSSVTRPIPKHVVDDAHEAERAGLDHGDSVQERTHRRRRGHGRRQPAMQRHQRRLHSEPDHEEREDDPQACIIQKPQIRRAGEFNRPGGALQPDNRDQQHPARRQGVEQI